MTAAAAVSPPVTRRLLTIKDVAERTAKSTRSIRDLMGRDQFPQPTRLGRSVRWDSTLLDSWLDAGAPTPYSDWAASRATGKRGAR